MFRAVPLPTIRSANNCIYSIWYLSHRYCYLPLSWKSWNWFECAVGGVRHSSSGVHTTVSTASGICHTVTAICRYRGRVGTGLSVLWVAHANIPIYIQQDATLHSFLYMETALHVSGGTSTHHQERIQLYLPHLLFVRPLLLPAAIVGCIPPYATHSTLKPVPTLPR